MTPSFSITRDLVSETATARLAERLAPILSPGDCLLLSGPIGAGKTHFARSLIQTRLRAAGLEEDVPSPTYTLVQTYNDGQTEIWHADLYRLTSADELIELGLDEAFQAAITVIEWPDRLGPETPPGALWLDFEAGPDAESRRLLITSDDEGWRGRLSGVLRADVVHG